MTNPEQWLIDLDGVIWLGTEPIKGSAEALDRLRESGRRIAFFTNNSYSTKRQLLDKFKSFSVTCAPDELLSSAQAAADLCEPGQHALCVGGHGISEALEARGVHTLQPEDYGSGSSVDVVVVGFDPGFNFARLTAAARAVNRGARLIGTNDDATYPMADGPVPGGGSMLHAVAYACGVVPLVAGKPNEAAIQLIHDRIGKIDVAVGDRPSTDGALAARLDARFALVHSGVKESLEDLPEVTVAIQAADLAELVDSVLKASTA